MEPSENCICFVPVNRQLWGGVQALKSMMDEVFHIY